jgi:hypothetical protein
MNYNVDFSGKDFSLHKTVLKSNKCNLFYLMMLPAQKPPSLCRAKNWHNS